MAYDAGYGGGQQRPYPGPAGQRPGPRRGDYGGASRPPPPQQAQYGGYDDGYGYDEYGGGYQDQYDGPYDKSYQQNYPPPPQQGRGPPPGRGRGGYPSRGGRPGPGPRRSSGGMGAPRPGPYSASSDPSANRRHPQEPPRSPRDPTFDVGNNGGYPNPSQRERPGIGPDRQMMDQMASMDLNVGPRMPPRQSSESQRSLNGYGRAPMNAGRGAYPAPQQSHGYSDPRRGPPPVREYGSFDDGFGDRGPPAHEFGPLARSMTMPVNEHDSRRQMPPPPPRSETATYDPYAQPPIRQPMPQRPATATGNRPLQQAMYGGDSRRPPSEPYGGNPYDQGQAYDQPDRAPVDDVYDSYYGNDGGNAGYGAGHHKNQSVAPDFDAISAHPSRGSFEQTLRPGHDKQPQAVPKQIAMLNHAKSQPDLRQPQAAVFEMAGDIPAVPPMPPMPQSQAFHSNNNSFGYDNHAGYEQSGYQQPPPAPQQPPQHQYPQPHQLPPRGPSAPPGPIGGAVGGLPPSVRPGGVPNRNPDALPSHPTPVRPGLMANSMVNMNDKPPPVRNYGGLPQARPTATPAPQLQHQQSMRQQQPVQQPQQQPLQSQITLPTELKPDPVTPHELEQLRQTIKTNPNDQEAALRLAKRLIEAIDVLAPALPDPKARTRARERYALDAQKVLKKLSSSAQNPEAMFFYADCLGRGVFGGQESDQKEAFTLYQSAAKLNHAAAAYRTAVCCEIGHEEGGGTRKDPTKAMQWYKRSATLGDPPAMYKLGMILLKGLLGQPRNPREAVGWLKRAAERADADNPHALHELALLYESAQPNDAIVRDERYALELFQQAAELGYKFSQFRMGCVYEFGLMGCPIDPRSSIMWYSRAATQEEHQSELALSGWYLTGTEGVLAQNDTEAYLWARKAAIAGLAKAEYAMGYFTEVGIGVPANLEDAKRWYWRAAAQDFPKARERLEDLKRTKTGSGPRARERISRSRIEKQQDGECSVM
ncbi:hypothetical protein NLU13_0426 [Sarocladium strictum]|uniref:Uncharacterized protein n=1 Tax=Sarocladium strictum TaxID=5046 RepID=A0AA39GP15_SARSR|nr:hypothetical protein NLU13_0426 [Sarocladium strictum]